MAAHRYSPAAMDLPAGYVPQRLSQLEILGPFYGTSSVVVLSVWLLSGRCGGLSKADRLLMCWWAFTGLIHFVIEGAFVFSPSFFTNSNPSYFDELWKEYSRADSRYITRNTAILFMEGMMALQGPVSLFAVYAIASRKSYNQLLQFSLSLGHVFATFLYYTTAYLDGVNLWTSPYYFWTYFIGLNSSWFVIAVIIARRSWKKISAAIYQVEKVKTK